MRTSIAFALAAAKLVAGHATFQSIIVDGKDQGQHFAVQTPSDGNNPIKDVTSTAMVCNGGTPKTEFVEVAAGSEVTMQWHHNDGASTAGDNDEPIAASHKGPVMVYIAKADASNGKGAVWTKIYEDGYSGGKWGVDNFIANKGAITVTLPNLADGEYLIRPEIIGLHEGDRQGGAQFYNGCGQLKVSGGSATLPATGTDLTKAYSATDPGVLVSIYGGLTSYKIPGPAVWDGASSGTTPTTPAPSTAPVASASPSKTATPVASASPVASPVEDSEPVATPTPAAPAPSAGSGSGSTLPETFTIPQFIAWLKTQAGSAKARRHARAFNL
ncbi:endoglucanase B [Paraphoma chrysanthemicola]|nr:endoglucanase B [Paraphoma chrysanthemicola]